MNWKRNWKCFKKYKNVNNSKPKRLRVYDLDYIIEIPYQITFKKEYN